MATSTLPFEIQIAQDLADLIEKVSQELRKQDDLLDPKVVSLFRIYLSAIRQYQSLSKHLTMAENPKPAAPAKPAGSPRPRLGGQSLSPLNWTKPVPTEPFPAPGLLRNPSDQASAIQISADLAPLPRERKEAATRLK